MTANPNIDAMTEVLDATNLVLPLIAAPMTAVSTPELVAAACAAGVIGAFPTSNPASSAELEEWLERIDAEIGRREHGVMPGPVAANLIVHRSNKRLDADLATIVEHGIQIAITSVGSPAPVVAGLHSAGCIVLADVASLMHAHKALEAGADGLVLLGAGAGGNTGWANPFAFARAVRRFFAGTLVLAGGVSDGTALWAAITLGYDFGYMGTKMIATAESGATAQRRRDVVESSLDDIVLGTSRYGVQASLLKASGSAGHSVSGVEREGTVEEVIRETANQWQSARTRTAAVLGTNGSDPPAATLKRRQRSP
jgi:nitronate monooxygenase